MSEPKKETVRITLPPRPSAVGNSPLKRETVRISLPSKPGTGDTPVQPKKESTRMTISNPPNVGAKPFVPPPAAPESASKVPSVAPSAPKPPAAVSQQTVMISKPAPAAGPSAPAKPPVPSGVVKSPPPRPPGAPSVPAAPKPPGAAGVPPAAPKAPGAPAAPSAPKPPTPPTGSSSGGKVAVPKASVTMTPSSQPTVSGPTKKETARIQLPAAGAQDKGMPKSTVKMSAAPSSVVQAPGGRGSSIVQRAPMPVGPAQPDKVSTILAVFALICSIAAFGMQLMAFLAATPS